MNSNTKKIIFIILIISIIGIILYFIFRKPKEKQTTVTVYEEEIKFPLKKGSTGNAVKRVQRYLNGKCNSGLVIDGDWQTLTTEAALNCIKRDNISEEVYYKWGIDKIFVP